MILNLQADALLIGRQVDTLFFLSDVARVEVFDWALKESCESKPKEAVLFLWHFYFYLLYLVNCEHLEYRYQLPERNYFQRDVDLIVTHVCVDSLDEIESVNRWLGQ